MFGTLIASIVAGETANVIGRTKRMAIVYAVAAFSALFGVMFGLIAVYVWMAREWGPVRTALGMAVFFTLAAVLIVAIHNMRTKRQAREATKRRAVDVKAIATTAAVAALPGLLSRKGSAVALLVPVLGVLGYLIYNENAPPRRRRPPREPFRMTTERATDER